MKVAKLVSVSVMTRVIVENTASDEEIMEVALIKLSENLMNSPNENVDEIKDDTECPYIMGEEFSLAIGDSVIAPDPKPDGTDLWNHGDWEGTIIDIKPDTDESLYASVQDGDGNVFDISLDRIKLY